MFQLRGLGGDCAANPNDPVCRAFYGDDSSGSMPYAIMGQKIGPSLPIVDQHIPSPAGTSIQPVSPGTSVVTAAGKPWWMSWWVLGLAAVAGIGLWAYSRPKKSPAAPAIAGLFGRR